MILVFFSLGLVGVSFCPLVQEVKDGRCPQLNCVIYCYGEKMRGRHQLTGLRTEFRGPFDLLEKELAFRSHSVLGEKTILSLL